MSQKNPRVTTEKINMAQIRNAYCNRLDDSGNDEAYYESRLSHFLETMSQKAAGMENLTLTENGALTYSYSDSALVDLNARATELRYASAEVIRYALLAAYEENPLLAVKLIFKMGDIRGGKGERKIFNACMDFLCESHPAVALEVLPLIPEYTRWDYLVRLVVSPDESIASKATAIVAEQFGKDLAVVRNTEEGKSAHISLLGKWMPSLQTKKADQKAVVRHLLRALRMKERDYRHALSELRNHLNVIEKSMSAKDFDNIDMEKMTAKQQLRYSDFLQRRMAQKRHAYIQAVLRGEAKMNASVLNPVDICHEYVDISGYVPHTKKYNEDLEALWSLLPDRMSGNGNTIVVRDGSGSMLSRLGGGSSATMLEAATAMTVYCAERLSGPLKDRFITFSSTPRLISLADCADLRERLNKIYRYDECSNTDIEATFDLLLETAIAENMKQEELPSHVLILSDMEFDMARGAYYRVDSSVSRQTLFTTIRKKWEEAGYQVPTLVFWNLNGHRTTFPEIDSENGVIYLSGFSTNELTLVMAGEFEQLSELEVEEIVIDEETGEEKTVTRTVLQRKVLSPLEQLKVTLSKERYAAVEEAARRGLEQECMGA